MEKTVSISQVIKNLKASEFFLSCGLPMDYRSGFPVFQVNNGALCLLVPFLKYKITGEVDKTQVFPIRYVISLELPTEKVVFFQNLEYNASFSKVNFDAPVGYFRHESIRQYNKIQYKALYHELLRQYDKVANALLFGREYSLADEARMAQLLQLLAEPSLLPMYKALDLDFFHKYFMKG